MYNLKIDKKEKEIYNKFLSDITLFFKASLTSFDSFLIIGWSPGNHFISTEPKLREISDIGLVDEDTKV